MNDMRSDELKGLRTGRGENGRGSLGQNFSKARNRGVTKNGIICAVR